jgi:carotene epsilon-monooxygenase
MEAVIALAVLLRRFDFALVPDQDIAMTTGATIHTQNGLFMTVQRRGGGPHSSSSSNRNGAAAAEEQVAGISDAVLA